MAALILGGKRIHDQLLAIKSKPSSLNERGEAGLKHLTLSTIPALQDFKTYGFSMHVLGNYRSSRIDMCVAYFQRICVLSTSETIMLLPASFNLCGPFNRNTYPSLLRVLVPAAAVNRSLFAVSPGVEKLSPRRR